MRSPHPSQRAAVLAGAAGLVLGLAVSGCGNQSQAGASGGQAATAEPRTDLTVTATADKGAEPKRVTLTCDPVGGNHPQAGKACKALGSAGSPAGRAKDPFAPVSKNTVCTEIYGGPQTATIRGTWQGEKVHATFSREGGCEIARWDRIAAVLPVKAGR